ncbi:MAG: hypothetical protein AVDCRST_MAG10-3147 [uncultured Acidimicrobiales bacterium]|uniref:Uncharacterized protein n=1 Tax=uncultured Acidimicrobiales bacterium TaxID=310071 RepID=A0A6J4J701_9ACTN|nr:MAG: hypothetical protein AVDCRST_MAG10-3147 [uncultured Acidimicrobiales bacterium]
MFLGNGYVGTSMEKIAFARHGFQADGVQARRRFRTVVVTSSVKSCSLSTWRPTSATWPAGS